MFEFCLTYHCVPLGGLGVQAFPVPGKYHFRALKTMGDMNVWLDLVDDAAVVPSNRGEVVLKVSRISLDIRTSPAADQAQQRASFSPRAKEEQTPSQPSNKEKSPRMVVPERRGSEKLLSFDTVDDSNTTPPACECEV